MAIADCQKIVLTQLACVADKELTRRVWEAFMPAPSEYCETRAAIVLRSQHVEWAIGFFHVHIGAAPVTGKRGIARVENMRAHWVFITNRFA